MLRVYRSIDEAWQAFAVYARREPRLWPLWELCRRAAPPVRETAFVDDVYADDPLENDPLATSKPDDGWCAEDYFLRHVKSKLLLLVGMYGPGEVHELYSREAYETIYDLLINWALDRSCVCCAEHHDDDDDAPRHRAGDGSPAYQ